jgi:hypothetical protein
MQKPSLKPGCQKIKIVDRRACPEPVEWAPSPATYRLLQGSQACDARVAQPPSAVALFYMKYRYQTLQTKDEN